MRLYQRWQNVKYVCLKNAVLEWLDRRKRVEKFADDHWTQLFKTLRCLADKHEDVGGCELVLITQELNQLHTDKHSDTCRLTWFIRAIMANAKIRRDLWGDLTWFVVTTSTQLFQIRPNALKALPEIGIPEDCYNYYRVIAVLPVY